MPTPPDLSHVLTEQINSASIDFDTLEDNAVTIRDRDTMSQERVALDRLLDVIRDRGVL